MADLGWSQDNAEAVSFMLNQNKNTFSMEETAMICILLLQVRRLRFRRPRPKLIDVENPDGDLVGSPVELKEQGEDVCAMLQLWCCS